MTERFHVVSTEDKGRGRFAVMDSRTEVIVSRHRNADIADRRAAELNRQAPAIDQWEKLALIDPEDIPGCALNVSATGPQTIEIIEYDDFLQVIAMSAARAKAFLGRYDEPTDLGPAPEDGRWKPGARVYGFHCPAKERKD